MRTAILIHRERARRVDPNLSTSFNSGVSSEVVCRRVGHVSTDTAQFCTLLAGKVAGTRSAPDAAIA